MKKTTASSGALALLVLLTATAHAQAGPSDLFIRFSDDGGATRVTISGFVDASGGVDLSWGAAHDAFGVNDFYDSFEFSRATTGFAVSSGVTFDGDPGNPTQLFDPALLFYAIPSNWVNTDDLALQLFGTLNVFRIIGLDGAFTHGPVEVNEDVTYPSVPFNTWYPGTWKFGNTTDAILGNGVTVQIGDADADHDGVPDSDDNCPLVANADQSDFDADGEGDACDADVDDDSVENDTDRCASTPAGDLVDLDGCSIAQLCPCSGPRGTTRMWSRLGAYVACTARVAEAFADLQLISWEEKDAIVEAAAQSQCGPEN